MEAVEDRGLAGGYVGVDDLQVVVLHCHQNSLKDSSLPARAANGDEAIQAADMQPHIRTQVGLEAGLAPRDRQGRERCEGICVPRAIDKSEAVGQNSLVVV